MKILHVTVRDKIATYHKRDGDIVCGNSDYVIEFDFDSEWDAYSEKKARFIWNGKHFDQAFTGTTCPVPTIKNATSCSVGVFAGDLSTTTPATIGCRISILCQSTTPQPESDAMYASQAQLAAEEARKSADKAANAADKAVKDAVTAATATAEEEVARLVGEIGVVQELGTSPTAVVSQAKVTKEFEHKQSQITRNAKEIENLKAGIPAEDFVVDDTVAAVKSVPADTLPYAEVVEVGGKTRKCENLLHLGSVEVKNTSGTYDLPTPIQAGTYMISAVIQSSDIDATQNLILLYNGSATIKYVYLGRSNGSIRVSVTFTINQQCTRIAFYASVDSSTSAGDSATFTDIMLNSGSTALPYEPYFDGLRSAPVTEVESVGVNLFDINAPHVEGPGGVYRYDLIGKPHTKYTFSTNVPDGNPTNIYVNGGSSGDHGIHVGYNRTITTNDNGEMYCEVRYRAVGSSDIDVYTGMLNGTYYLQIEEGETATDYTPYVRNTLPIPEAVQALDGYGWGINDEVYNYIDWEKRQFVKRVELYNLGEVDWVYNADSTAVYCTFPNTLTGNFFASNDYFLYFNPDLNALVLNNTGVSSDEEIQAHFDGVYAVVELATPIITDISDLLPADNLIGVEGGGTVTMVNEYGYDVPSEIVYQINHESEVSA